MSTQGRRADAQSVLDFSVSVQKRRAGDLFWRSRSLWIEGDDLLYGKPTDDWVNSLRSARAPKRISLSGDACLIMDAGVSGAAVYQSMDDRQLRIRSGAGVVYDFRFGSSDACEEWMRRIQAAIESASRAQAHA